MSVLLRKPRSGDAEVRAALGYDPDIVRGYGLKLQTCLPMDLEDAQAWVARIETHEHAWIIGHQSRLLGEVRLDNLSTGDRRASLAVAIVDRRKLGQGLGRASIKACLKFAFEDLNLHRVSVRVLASNTRAIRCYESCGFHKEGVEREAALTDWGWEDDVIMGVLSGA